MKSKGHNLDIQTNQRKPIERVTVDESNREKLGVLTEQGNSFLGGLAKLTKSDIVNLLVAEHPNELSKAQLSSLKDKHFDPVKCAYLVAKKLRSARTEGQDITMEEVLKAFHYKNKRGKKNKNHSCTKANEASSGKSELLGSVDPEIVSNAP